MLGHRLITKQTPKEGIFVKKVMIAESVNIMRETYICILMDRLALHYMVSLLCIVYTCLHDDCEMKEELSYMSPLLVYL
jgi:hypothetical protein